MSSYVLVPTSDRGPNSATPFPATGSHFLRAATNDGDAGYLRYTTGAEREFFGVTPDIADNEVIDSVALSIRIRNALGGSEVRGIVRRSGADFVLIDEFVDVFQYITYGPVVMFTDPLDGAPWTVSKLTSAEIGCDCPSVNGQVRFTYANYDVLTHAVAEPSPIAPFIKQRPEANGFFTDWSLFSGAGAAWDCVNDVISDGDASYVEMGQNREVSFRFGGLSNVLPKRIDLFVTARRVGGPSISVDVGFCNRGGGFNASLLQQMSLTGSYVTSAKSFSVHPIRGDAYRPGDLNYLEIFLRTPQFTIGTWRASRLEVVVSYDEPSAYRVKSELKGSVVA